MRQASTVIANSLDTQDKDWLAVDAGAASPNRSPVAHSEWIRTSTGEPESSGWRGARGFVHEAAKEHFANDFRGHKAYLCGPPLMIDACISTLMQGRLFERDIYTERFISAADAQQVRSPLFKKI